MGLAEGPCAVGGGVAAGFEGWAARPLAEGPGGPDGACTVPPGGGWTSVRLPFIARERDPTLVFPGGCAGQPNICLK